MVDNTVFRKSTPTQTFIARMEATLLFLTPYSPDFDLIEHEFAALKRQSEYRKAGIGGHPRENASVIRGLAVIGVSSVARVLLCKMEESRA